MADNPQAAVLDYGASKAALNHLTTGLARQLIPRGIRVNAVQPALTYTPLLSTMGFTGEIGTEIASVVPYGRLEQPAELAPLFVSLADPSGTFTSGNAYSAAGGATFR
jgi:NAD(P)-dependent dehydrogenase (short-subunit alcohol dehydrogenase family)